MLFFVLFALPDYQEEEEMSGTKARFMPTYKFRGNPAFAPYALRLVSLITSLNVNKTSCLMKVLLATVLPILLHI